MAGRFVRVSDEAWSVLQKVAAPLEDGVSDAILRLGRMAGITSDAPSERDDKSAAVSRDGSRTRRTSAQTFETGVATDFASATVLSKPPQNQKTTPAITPRLLSIPQAAVYLGRSAKAVRNMIDRRELPVVRTGRRRIHLDRIELDRLIEAAKP